MKIAPIGRLTGNDDQYMVLVDAVELEDLHACVKHACRLLEYHCRWSSRIHTADDHECKKIVAFFADLPNTRDRRALERAFDGEYERVVK